MIIYINEKKRIVKLDKKYYYFLYIKKIQIQKKNLWII